MSCHGGVEKMQIHGPAHLHGPQPINSPHKPHAPQPASPSQPVTEPDQLDISQEADMVSRLRELPGIRHDLVARIRSEIEAGTYETDEKLDIALGRMLDEMGE